jgi:hypothetical protein
MVDERARADEINATLKRVHAKHPKARDHLMGPRYSFTEYLTARPHKRAKMDAAAGEAAAAFHACEEELRAEFAAMRERWAKEDA